MVSTGVPSGTCFALAVGLKAPRIKAFGKFDGVEPGTQIRITAFGLPKKYHVPRADPHYAMPNWPAHMSRRSPRGI